MSVPIFVNRFVKRSSLSLYFSANPKYIFEDSFIVIGSWKSLRSMPSIKPSTVKPVETLLAGSALFRFSISL